MKGLRGGDEDDKEDRDDGQGQGDLGCTGVSPFCFRHTHRACSPPTTTRVDL